MSDARAVEEAESWPPARPAEAQARGAELGIRLARLGLLAVAVGLRVWRLDQSGYGNEYYTAAVRSMAASWHNALYNAFDPAGFVSVDKPPLALWIQVASVKVFGFRELAVLLPQVVEGLLSVALVHALVLR